MKFFIQKKYWEIVKRRIVSTGPVCQVPRCKILGLFVGIKEWSRTRSTTVAEILKIGVIGGTLGLLVIEKKVSR